MGRDNNPDKPQGASSARKPVRLSRNFDFLFPIAYAVVYLVAGLYIHFSFFPVGDTGVESDFYSELVVAAQKLWKGNFAVAYYPYKGPFYSFALVFIRLFVRDWYNSGIVLNLLCAAGSLIVLYRMLLRLFCRNLAALAVVSTSLVYEYFLLSHKASSDMLFFLLCFLAINLLARTGLSWRRFAMAGILSALAFLTRYIGIFLPAGTLLMLFLVNPGREHWKKRVGAFIVYAFLFMAVCSPWFVMNHQQTGAILSTRNVENIVEEFYGGTKEHSISPGKFDSVSSLIAHDPGYFFGHFLLNIPRHFWMDMRGTLGIPAGILVMLGLVRLIFIPPSRKRWAFYIYPLCYFLPMCAVFHLRRFSIPITPAYYAIGFSFLVPCRDMNSSRAGPLFGRITDLLKRWRILLAVLFIGLVSAQIVRIVKHERFYYQARPLFVLDAASFLNSHMTSRRKAVSATVMARKPHIAYYAGMQYLRYPRMVMDPTEFLAYGTRHNADYIVYSLIEQKHYPDWHFLMELDSTPGVIRIYNKPEIVIYELARWTNMRKAQGKRALEDFRARLREAIKKGDTERILQSYFNLAEYHAMNGDWEGMGEYLIDAIAYAEQMPDSAASRQFMGLFRLKLAQSYLLAGDYDTCLSRLRQSVILFKERGESANLARAHVLIAQVHYKKGEWGAALEHYRAARAVYLSLGRSDEAEIVGRVIRDLEKND